MTAFTKRFAGALCMIVVALVMLACGMSALIAPTTHAEVACRDCQRQVVAVGQTVSIRVDWPCGEPDPEESEEVQAAEERNCREAVQASILCEGVRCHSDVTRDQGVLFAAVQPLEAGSLRIRVRLEDGIADPRIEVMPQLRVVAPDRLAIDCLERAPGAPSFVGCESAVPVGHDVQLAIAVYAGGERLSELPITLQVDGDDPNHGDAPFQCLESAAVDDGGGPLLRCTAHGVAAGQHRFEAAFGPLHARFDLMVGEIDAAEDAVSTP